MGLIRLGSKPPLTVSPTESATRAASAMTERGVGAAAVLDGTKVIGIVTERDLMKKIVAEQRDPVRTTVRDIMTSPALSIRLKTTVDEAANLMRKHHIRHLLVLDEHDALVGIVALRYLLYDLMDDLKRDVGDLMGYVMTDGPGG
jgi:CBS domain-containing protein